MANKRPFQTLLWALLLFGVAGCRPNERAEIHLIAEGYRGPVVILFNAPNGAEVRKEQGAFVYEIASSGLASLRERYPEKTPSRPRFFYVDGQGRRTEIPFSVGGGSLQAYGLELGNRTIRFDGASHDIDWIAYLVGAPGSAHVDLREAVEQAARGMQEGVRSRKDPYMR